MAEQQIQKAKSGVIQGRRIVLKSVNLGHIQRDGIWRRGRRPQTKPALHASHRAFHLF